MQLKFPKLCVVARLVSFTSASKWLSLPSGQAPTSHHLARNTQSLTRAGWQREREREGKLFEVFLKIPPTSTEIFTAKWFHPRRKFSSLSTQKSRANLLTNEKFSLRSTTPRTTQNKLIPGLVLFSSHSLHRSLSAVEHFHQAKELECELQSTSNAM